VLLPLTACGGGLPLLHPAQTLSPGDVRAVAGFSSNAFVGGFTDALQNVPKTASTALPPSGPSYARAALVEASVAPGLAPLVGARVGLGMQFEGGIGYTGRTVRLDARRSFDLSSHWAMSLGAGAMAEVYGHDDAGVVPALDPSQLHGWGADVPIVIGYTSDAELYMVWIGARTGWEHVDSGAPASLGTVTPMAPSPVLSATRFWGGGLLGFAVGFRHLHAAIELDCSYATVSGAYGATRAEVIGATIAPASAVWWRF
jgi:hypothetical protein